MLRTRKRRLGAWGGALLALSWLWPASGLAVDGVVEINQARALAGAVTPGDAAGFPVSITQSGSYRLTGSLSVSDPDVSAIFVANVDDVTIDLNGFTISGPAVCSDTSIPECTKTGFGDGVGGTGENITVRNGTVRGMGRSGVFLQTSGKSRVLGVRALGNGSNGVDLAFLGVIEDCFIDRNGGFGISTGASSVVRDNLVTFNGTGGIRVASGVLVSNNKIAQTAGIALDLGLSSGYADNVISATFTTVSGGTEYGTNLCNGTTTCP